MDINTMLIALIPITGVLVFVAFKLIFTANKKGRENDVQKSNQVEKSTKKDKKKPRKKIETAPVAKVSSSGDNATKAKVTKKVVEKEVKPVVKNVEKVNKVNKPTKDTKVTKEKNIKNKDVKIEEEKPIRSKRSKKSSETEANNEDWITVAKKGKSVTPKPAEKAVSSVINDHISEKATLTIEEVLNLGKKAEEPKKEEPKKVEPKKVVVQKKEVKKTVEKKSKKADLIVPSVEDQIEDAMEEFETVKSRNRKNKKQNEDKPNQTKHIRSLHSPPSYEESLNQIAQEKAAAITFDEMGALEAAMQPKVKPSKKKKSRRD